MTGLDFTNEFLERIGQDFTGYAGNDAKLTSLFKKSMLYVVKNLYRNLDDEREREAIMPFTVLSKEIPAGAAGDGMNYAPMGSSTNDDKIPQLLYTCGTYSNLLKGLSATTLLITSTKLEITFNIPSNIRSTEFIHINITNSNTIPDMDFGGYVKQLTDFKYLLYKDVALTDPFTSTDYPASFETYSVWRKYIKRELKPLPFDQKGKVGGKPTVWRPRYQLGKTEEESVYTSNMYLYPDNVDVVDKSFVFWHNINTDSVEIAYDIVSGDDTVDIETIFTLDFIYMVMEEAARQYSLEKRDVELYQTSTNETLTQ